MIIVLLENALISRASLAGADIGLVHGDIWSELLPVG